MKLFTILNNIGILLCAGLTAFCAGAAIATGKTHILVEGAIFLLITVLLIHSRREDKKEEEEGLRHE